MPLPSGVVTGGGLFENTVRAAVFRRIKTDPELTQMSNGVYDGMVQTTEGAPVKPPYIILGAGTEISADRLTTVARTVFLVIEVYSDYDGFKEVGDIMGRIATLLDHQERMLLSAKWILNSVRFESSQTIVDPDGIRHGIMRLEAIGQPRW